MTPPEPTMSIPGNTPYYVRARKRQDGMLDYILMNPRGWGNEEVVHVALCAARDEEQARGRIQNLLPPWQTTVEFIYAQPPEPTMQDTPTPPGLNDQLGSLVDGLRALPNTRPEPEPFEVWRDACGLGLAAADEIERLQELADSEGTRAVTYLRRARKAEKVLRELVALEDMRLRLRQLHEMGQGTDYSDYHRLLPLAWDAAREALGPNDGVEPHLATGKDLP